MRRPNSFGRSSSSRWMRAIKSRPIPRVDFPSLSSSPLPAAGHHSVTWTSLSAAPTTGCSARHRSPRSPPVSAIFSHVSRRDLHAAKTSPVGCSSPRWRWMRLRQHQTPVAALLDAALVAAGCSSTSVIAADMELPWPPVAAFYCTAVANGDNGCNKKVSHRHRRL